MNNQRDIICRDGQSFSYHLDQLKVVSSYLNREEKRQLSLALGLVMEEPKPKKTKEPKEEDYAVVSIREEIIDQLRVMRIFRKAIIGTGNVLDNENFKPSDYTSLITSLRGLIQLIITNSDVFDGIERAQAIESALVEFAENFTAEDKQRYLYLLAQKIQSVEKTLSLKGINE